MKKILSLLFVSLSLPTMACDLYQDLETGLWHPLKKAAHCDFISALEEKVLSCERNIDLMKKENKIAVAEVTLKRNVMNNFKSPTRCELPSGGYIFYDEKSIMKVEKDIYTIYSK